jgi:hypothetical protein
MTIPELKPAAVDKVATIDEDRTEARVRQLPDTLATVQCNGVHLPDVMCRKLAVNVWVINSILGHVYRRFCLFFPVSIYYL